MASKKVYIVKSGTLHKTINEYWLTPSYHTSKKGALASAQQTLEINRATDIVESPVYGYHDIKHVDYVGEEGKYKGRILIEWAYLNSY